MENIIDLMAKYNLTLRRLSSEEVSYTRKNGEFVRHVKRHTPGWIVKVDSSHGTLQQWSMKYDFYAATAEEAIQNAINSINAKQKTT